ncbi:MAG: conjugal transfer protein TraF [Armatimonadota bacterium]
MKKRLLIPFVALWVLSVGVSADEISVFGSPSRGMAGAGIARLHNPGKQMFLNPAAVAYVRGVDFGLSNLNMDTEGATLRQIYDTVKIGQKGVVDLADAARIVRTFGEKEKVQAVLNADFGLIFNGVAVTAGVVGDFRLYPNTALQRWARGQSNDLTGAQGDIYGVVAVSLPDVTFGTRLSAGEGSEVAIGARVRFLRAFYTHYYADQADLSSGNAGSRAVELGGSDYLDKRGTSVDFGIVWKPNRELAMTYAVVVENLIEPNIEFPYTAPNTVQGAGAPQTTIKPIKRAIHLGIASEGAMGVIYAVDWVDITNNTGKRELRFGVEKRLTGGLAVRAGYGTKNGWAVGGEIFGINIAVAQKFPLQVSRTLTF